MKTTIPGYHQPRGPTTSRLPDGGPFYRLTRSDPRQQPVLDNTPTTLDQELPALPSRTLPVHLFELLGVRLQFFPDHVVQHDDVRTRIQRLRGLFIRLAFYRDQQRKACGTAARLDGPGDGPGSPDVVVLEHDHAGEVVPVRIYATDHHTVLFDEPEAGGRLPRPSDLALPP